MMLFFFSLSISLSVYVCLPVCFHSVGPKRGKSYKEFRCEFLLFVLVYALLSV